MARHATITVNRSPDEVQDRWESSEHRPAYVDEAAGAVSFVKAPGDRGTEIHVELEGPKGGKVGEAVLKLVGSEPKAKVMDDLRRFKQVVETGVVTRSEGAPEGEQAERKLKQRPAQPLEDSEIEKAGV